MLGFRDALLLATNLILMEHLCVHPGNLSSVFVFSDSVWRAEALYLFNDLYFCLLAHVELTDSPCLHPRSELRVLHCDFDLFFYSLIFALELPDPVLHHYFLLDSLFHHQVLFEFVGGDESGDQISVWCGWEVLKIQCAESKMMRSYLSLQHALRTTNYIDLNNSIRLRKRK